MIAVLRRKYASLISDKKFSEILTGSALALTARVAATLIGMATNIFIARFYGAATMGILAMVNSFLTLVTIFTVLGTSTSILRLVPEHVVKYSVTSALYVYRKTQYFVAAVSLVTGTLFYFGSELVADKVFSKPHLSFFFALAAIFVVFKSLMLLNTQAVRGLQLIKAFAFMQALPSLSMLLFLLVSTAFVRNSNNAVYAQLAAFAVTAMAGELIMNRAFRKRMRPDDAINPMPIRDIASVSFPMLMTASMQFFIGQTGVIVLGMFRSESEVGHYAIAVKLATLTTFVLQAINSMAAPKFSELYNKGNMEELFHVARKSTKLIFWTTAPVLLALIVLGKPLLGVVFGEEFTISYSAMVLLIIGQFVNSISGSTGGFMLMCGYQNAFRNIIFVAAVLNIALSFALIPGYGIIGAACAGMVSLAFWNVYVLYFIKRKYGKSIGYFPLLR